MGATAAVCGVLLCSLFVSALGDEHSLYYIYTALNKDIALPGIYEFTALGLLDDREIDYYNSKEQIKVPKQDWMREKMQPDYWEKGTQSRKSKEQWFKVNVDILMQRMRHNESDLHVLQWRHGCEINETDGTVTFLKDISEYGYDGAEILSFDNENLQWIASVPEAVPTKDKWDHVPILNKYTEGYLEKECVDWLTKFIEYEKEALKKQSPPDVHMFAKKSATDSKKLTLTCLVTGFYTKDVEVSLRKFRTSLPEHLSSGVRPNEDGTYQLRKSVDIQEDEKADYDCYVAYSTLDCLKIKQRDRHSLYYIYTALNKDIALSGIYEFTALGLLDDREIDYYNSKEQMKVPKQDWMREKMQPDYWEKGTQSRKSKEQWFKVNVDILMQRMRHNESDLHVLQWRHGCEINKTDGTVTFLKGISEYGYDGAEILSFDNENLQWIASVPEAVPTKDKWDNVPILNKYTKGYLEKECVDWLTKFMEYEKEALKKQSPPDVHMFAKKSATDSKKLTLTCLVTGFYTKDVEVSLRKFRTSLPEHLSSGVRPNEDGTYQLRKSVDIQEDEKADYDCYVAYSTLDCLKIKQRDRHSLYYIYTALNKDIALSGIYEFTALGLLDDREIDYYNSKEQMKVPKQDWMREKMQPDYWEKGTQSRKSKEQWFKVNVDILMQRMRHNESDLHVLQWRHGCEINKTDGTVTFLKGISEYGYDGAEILSFDNENLQWIASVPEAVPTKDKWDNVPILNKYTKGYLEKECVDWLTKFMEYEKEALKKQSPPDVHMFAKKSATDSKKLTLTCLVTGFYTKDVEVSLRKFRTSLPEHLSSGVRPNEDGTYQLRKSVDIQEDEKADYDCYVAYSTLDCLKIKQRDRHSLYYIYTALNKDIALSGIYEFTALGLLDDREIDYYNSKEQMKVPKQDWMREKMQPDYWEKGTQSRKSKEQWFKVNVDILMQRMRHNESDLHVLQWRHGCEINKTDGTVTFLKGISEYGYDGAEILSFDNENLQWIASVPEAVPTKDKWDNVPILNKYTKGYLEKECVDWLTKFMEYEKEALKKQSPLDVHMFAKKSAID